MVLIFASLLSCPTSTIQCSCPLTFGLFTNNSGEVNAIIYVLHTKAFRKTMQLVPLTPLSIPSILRFPPSSASSHYQNTHAIYNNQSSRTRLQSHYLNTTEPSGYPWSFPHFRPNMSPNVPFIFNSAPSSLSELDVAMPCYECSMLGYGMTCQACSRFTATTPTTPPSSPAFSFSFECAPFLGTGFSRLETPLSTDGSVCAIKQPSRDWPGSETVGIQESSPEPSPSDWSEIDSPTERHAFGRRSLYVDLRCPSLRDMGSGPQSKCAVCSMVPYGAICAKCARVQTSEAVVFATPPAAAWPVARRLGDWEGSKAPEEEEELLRDLDAELFERINVLESWGRRVCSDGAQRIM